jgi:uncharacterized protein (TIGR00661 family)
MRLLYGVVGEGMGHAIRSRVVLEHLFAQGHEVEIMASSRAADYLAKRFPQVHRIHGLHIIYEENRVQKGATLLTNAIDVTTALPKQIRAYFKLIEDFKPDAVVSDFESWTYFYAKLHRLPIVSVDNMQVLSRCNHDPELLKGIRTQFELIRAFVASKLPFCDHYMIATFFVPEARKDNTPLVPPILRPEILAAKARARSGDHLLVYQTAEGHTDLPRALAELEMPCRIYGMRRDLAADVVEGSITYRPFNEETFIEDLATAKAVVSGGSFTLMGECVYLHKPMLSVPVVGQIEQVVNSRYLERVGYGQTSDHADAEVLRRFLADLPRLQENLEKYQQDGNTVALGTLDALLDRAAAGL